jgi:small subunit ribosomal protein S3Ae
VQDLNTKDGITIRVKSLAIIRGKIKSSIRTTIRNKIKELMKAEVEALTLDEFIESIISDDTKNKILKEARKIYPVRNFEIRKTEVMGPTK